MYYETGEIRRNFITVDGFTFHVKGTKTQFGVFVEITDKHEDLGLQLAHGIFEEGIYNWIEQNKDEADRIMNRVMQW